MGITVYQVLALVFFFFTVLFISLGLASKHNSTSFIGVAIITFVIAFLLVFITFTPTYNLTCSASVQTLTGSTTLPFYVQTVTSNKVITFSFLDTQNHVLGTQVVTNDGTLQLIQPTANTVTITYTYPC